MVEPIPEEQNSDVDSLDDRLDAPTKIQQELDVPPEEDVVPTPPDGGWGWMIVFASFMANLVVDGIAYSFGIFLEHFRLHFNSTEGTTALAGSLLTGVYLTAGPIVGGLVNRFGSRRVMIAGSLVSTVAFFVSVWSPQLIHFLILYGVLGGFGFGLIYLPAIVHVGYYFEQKRAVATGIAVAGSGFGNFVFPPIVQLLIDQYGWQGCQWIMAGFILNCAVFGALLRPLPDPWAVRKIEQEQLRDRINSISSQDSIERRRFHHHGNAHNISESSAGNNEQHHVLLHAPPSPKQHRRADDHDHNLTAREYTASMHKISVASSMGAINPREFTKPMARRDIFYSGSIQHLPEFKTSRGDISLYRQSMVSIPKVVTFEPQTGAPVILDEEPPACLSYVPKPIRDILVQMFDLRLMKNPIMILLCLSNSLGMMAFYVPYVYIITRAKEAKPPIAAETASFLLSIIGIANTLGRVFFGWVSDRQWVSALTINNGCLIICGVATIICVWFNSFAEFAAYAAIFGFFVSAYISLTSIILVDYFGIENLTNTFGIIILFRGIFATVGSPVGGAVAQATGSLELTFYYAGGLMLAAAAISILIPFVKRIEDWYRNRGQPSTVDPTTDNIHSGNNVLAMELKPTKNQSESDHV